MKIFCFLFTLMLIFYSCDKSEFNPQKDSHINIPKIDEAIYIGPQIKIYKESREVILTQTEPWENQMLGYFNVVEIKDRFPQLWYTSWKDNYLNDLSSFLCYAEYKDGLWNKIMDFNNTNILMGDGRYYGVVEQFVFFDYSLNEYKMIGVALNSSVGKSYTYLYTSEDGINWKDRKLLFPAYYDTQFSVIIDGDHYIIYQRLLLEGGKRVVGKSIIDNNGNIIMDPTLFFTDNNDKEYNHIYNNAASKLDNNRIVFFPTYYNAKEDLMYISFAFEENGKIIPVRVNLTPDLFENEIIGWAVVSPNLISTGEANTYWMYYYGSSLTHNRRVKDKGGYTNYYRVKIQIND